MACQVGSMWDSERRALSLREAAAEREAGGLAGELSNDGVGGCGKESSCQGHLEDFVPAALQGGDGLQVGQWNRDTIVQRHVRT
jgi:hypothetical protein